MADPDPPENVDPTLRLGYYSPVNHRRNAVKGNRLLWTVFLFFSGPPALIGWGLVIGMLIRPRWSAVGLAILIQSTLAFPSFLYGLLLVRRLRSPRQRLWVVVVLVVTAVPVLILIALARR
jgi:hypothetical protein